jgi:hypothetical protein
MKKLIGLDLANEGTEDTSSLELNPMDFDTWMERNMKYNISLEYHSKVIKWLPNILEDLEWNSVQFINEI